MTTLLYTTFTFEASHSLTPGIGLPQIHGHSYWARVWVASPPERVTPCRDWKRLPRESKPCSTIGTSTTSLTTSPPWSESLNSFEHSGRAPR